MTDHAHATTQTEAQNDFNHSFRQRQRAIDMSSRRLKDSSEEPVSPNDAKTLRDTMVIYGSLYVGLLFLFCIVRRRFKAYNVRAWSEKVKCKLAEENYGFISWMWRLYVLSEDEILDNCGMDALCFLRMLSFGFKVSLMGTFTATWLMPIYATAPWSEETSYIDDNIVKVSVSNVPPSNNRLIATAIAAWIIFGFTMQLILREFHWFTLKRHRFLSKQMPRNYTIYIRGLAPEYRSNSALLAFFRESFSHDSVLEARVALEIPRLEKKVARRETVIGKLEHAIAWEELKGVAPTHIVSVTGEKAKSIETYSAELRILNKEITEAIESIELLNLPQSFQKDLEDARSVSMLHQSIQRSAKSYPMNGSVASLKANPADESVRSLKSYPRNGSVASLKANPTNESVASLKADPTDQSVTSSLSEGGNFQLVTSTASPRALEQIPEEIPMRPNHSKSDRNLSRQVSDIGASTLRLSSKFGSAVGDSAAKIGSKVGNTAKAIFIGEDGAARESGFVTFTNLSTTHAALQMLHDHSPFKMEVAEAPNPEDVFWWNVGKTHEQLQTGKILGLSLTVLLCFFWTIPVAFVTSLSSVDALKESIPWLNDLIERFPALEPILAQLAPLLIIILNQILPDIVIQFAKLEGPVSTSILEASLFVKLAAFQIIQTFFVSSISGSITKSITDVASDPSVFIDLLATSLPTQAIFYVQILLVSTFLGQALELLGVIRLFLALLRRFIGPNLTEKEKNSSWMFFYPLADPWEFEYAEVLAEGILYFMVTFVYSTLAPITNFFLAFCYVLLGAGYRHQFVYVYPPTPDSGGRLWTGFIAVVQSCMLIAQITLFGYFGLKKNPIAAGFMVPLIVVTILFNCYLRQEHFRVADYLPTMEARSQDLKNAPLDFTFLKRAYLQPAMQAKIVLPDNFGIEREIAHETLRFLTPPHSEAEILDEEPISTEISWTEQSMSGQSLEKSET